MDFQIDRQFRVIGDYRRLGLTVNDDQVIKDSNPPVAESGFATVIGRALRRLVIGPIAEHRKKAVPLLQLYVRILIGFYRSRRLSCGIRRRRFSRWILS